MTLPWFRRIQLTAPPPDAAEIATVIGMITASPPRIYRVEREDDSETTRSSVDGPVAIEITADPRTSVPAMLAFRVPDAESLRAAVARVAGVGHEMRLWPSAEHPVDAVVEVAGIRIAVALRGVEAVTA